MIWVIFTYLGYIHNIFIFPEIRLARKGLNCSEETTSVSDVHFIISHAIYHGYDSPYVPFIVYGKFPQGLIWIHILISFSFCDVCRERDNVSYKAW